MVSSTTASAQPPVTLAGIVSGLDTKTMIQQLLAAERAQIQPLQNLISAHQTSAGAYQGLVTGLSALLTTIKSFSDPNYLEGTIASVAAGGSSVTVAATGASGAAAGSFQVTVDHLATATSVSSPGPLGAAIDPTALLKNDASAIAVTAGTFTVNGQQVAIDPAVDSLNSVMSKVAAAAPGTSASLVPDAGGRANLLRISNTAGVQLGAVGDTSNFLTATNLLASPAGTARTSTADLGVAQSGALLQSANLVTSLNGTTGSFTINGTTIAWDATRDSVSTVLGRINSSAAGVVASYSASSDTITLANRTTGSTAINLQDVQGTFLAAVGLAGTTQQVGSNSQIRVNTGQADVTVYGTTNTIANAVPGVTLNLLKQGTSPDTVTVGADADGAVAKMKSFVDQLNAMVDQIAQDTAASTASTPDSKGALTSTGATAGPLAGDYSIQQIGNVLHEILAGSVDGVAGGINSISQAGLSFGAVGSAAGATNHLVLNEAAFRSALQSNSAGVSNLFAAFGANATLQSGGADVQSLAGSPTSLRTAGAYQLTTVLTGVNTATVTAIFTPADGGPATTTVAPITAGGTNTTLIPGVTLSFKSSIQAGTDTINVTTPTRGLEAKLEQYLDPLTATGGQLSQLQNDAQTSIKQLNSQIASLNTNLTATQTRLQNAFARMEQALVTLNEQRATLSILAGTTTTPSTTGL